jgi:hypothetical protein
MESSRDRELEALIGRVCLIFARVEHEAGHVVASANGGWGQMSTEYLSMSSNSRLLLDWLKNVGEAYPEVKDDVDRLSTNLRALKALRDEWAHSAAVVDLFLMMREQDLSSTTSGYIDLGKLLNAKKAGHVKAPTAADVEEFTARASELGDDASALGIELAKLADHGVRSVKTPRKARSRAAR